MKKREIITIIIFFLLLMLPLIKFNTKENTISEIDNRILANNPFGKNATPKQRDDLTASIEMYISDRIGFRSEIIRTYTLLNDKLFSVMVHPSYTYGIDGYVFFKHPETAVYTTEYHRDFANMIIQIQKYCNDRNIPFVFVFEPLKNTVLEDKLASGINYNNDWTKEFLSILDQNGVSYVNNKDLLIKKTKEGEEVFNRKFNAGHWNDLGAFYGVNNALSVLKKQLPNIYINKISDFSIEEKLNTTLLASEFSIHEYEPIFNWKVDVETKTDLYNGEVKTDYNYRYFQVFNNTQRLAEGAPRALVFQGSYFNGMGYKFMANSFSEYIAVHDYQNVLNFEYYFNLFNPDCVVFEVAEYTVSNLYFNWQELKDFSLQPLLSAFDNLPHKTETLQSNQINITSGQAVTTINVSNLPTDTLYAYIKIGENSYDLQKEDDGTYSLTLLKDNYTEIQIVTIDENKTCCTIFE